MPEQLITHKIRLGLSECAEKRGETLADDFYVTVSIGDEGPEGPQRICTLRELLMEEAKLSGCLENELRLPPQRSTARTHFHTCSFGRSVILQPRASTRLTSFVRGRAPARLSIGS